MERVGVFGSDTCVHGGHAFPDGTFLHVATSDAVARDPVAEVSEIRGQGEGGERALCCAKNDLRHGLPECRRHVAPARLLC